MSGQPANSPCSGRRGNLPHLAVNIMAQPNADHTVFWPTMNPARDIGRICATGKGGEQALCAIHRCRPRLARKESHWLAQWKFGLFATRIAPARPAAAQQGKSTPKKCSVPLLLRDLRCRVNPLETCSVPETCLNLLLRRLAMRIISVLS